MVLNFLIKCGCPIQAFVLDLLKNYLAYQRAKYELQKNEKFIIANLEKQDDIKRKKIETDKEILITIKKNMEETTNEVY